MHQHQKRMDKAEAGPARDVAERESRTKPGVVRLGFETNQLGVFRSIWSHMLDGGLGGVALGEGCRECLLGE